MDELIFIEDDFEKVIFLDIDGVLNDEGKKRRAGILIDEECVKRLAYIIEQTNARVIISSSWRTFYKKFMDHNYQDDDIELHTLHNLLEKYQIKIFGMTDTFYRGFDSRPAEIRSWLATHPVKSFVILDDIPYWNWNWLKHFMVLTYKETDDGYQKGLTDEHCKKAISILNNI